MKILTIFMLILIATVPTFAQSAAQAESRLSPAELAIGRAEKIVAMKPSDYEAYNALALALSRRARETSDARFYAQAEEALQKSFAISPDNFDGARIHAWLLLGKHEFAAALEQARKLNKRAADDVMVYGLMTDANVELGNYKEAEESAQWMLN